MSYTIEVAPNAASKDWRTYGVRDSLPTALLDIRSMKDACVRVRRDSDGVLMTIVSKGARSKGLTLDKWKRSSKSTPRS